MSLTAERQTTAFARFHRLRRTPALRRLVRETRLDPAMLVLPLFVDANIAEPTPIAALPGHSRLPVRGAVEAAARASDEGIGGVLLFGLPETKDESGTASADPLGPVPSTIRAIKSRTEEIAVIADVCLCEYTSHGHCGVLREGGAIDNDRTLEVLAEAARVYADAGADVLAPSDMMDGRVAAIRSALDSASHEERAILSYAAKYASSLYGPFREAADCAPAFGDRAAYQMDPPNRREALAELAADVAEGADALMIKPAGPYLDVIAAARERFDLPIAAYQVSGEYATIVAAADRGWIDRRRTALESLTAIARAGAGVIVSYFALEAAAWLRQR
jgi:porphobilinogen synthase